MKVDGGRGGTRTPDLLVRSQTLYPTELRARTPQMDAMLADRRLPGPFRRLGKPYRVTSFDVLLRISAQRNPVEHLVWTAGLVLAALSGLAALVRSESQFSVDSRPAGPSRRRQARR